MTAIIARRAFIAALGGAAAWSIAARGQQRERMRLVGYVVARDARAGAMQKAPV